MHPAALTSPCGVQPDSSLAHPDELLSAVFESNSLEVELPRGMRNEPCNAQATILLALTTDANEDLARCVRSSARASHRA